MNWKLPYYEVGVGIDWVKAETHCEWLTAMANTIQDHIWHAEGDVYTHTKMVCSELANLPEFGELTDGDKHIVMAAAMMHDIEKPSTTTKEERGGRICVVAPKHAKRGEYTARKILYTEWVCPLNVREEICALVRYHGVPLWGSEDSNVQRRSVGIAERCRMNLLIMLAKADVLGRVADDNHQNLENIEYYEMLVNELGILREPYAFKTDQARYNFLSNDDGWIDYVPFEDRKFVVHMLCGIAGAGKDTYYHSVLNELPMVSLDSVRNDLGIDPRDKPAQGLVAQTAREQCRVHMRKHNSFVFNATNLTRNTRTKWISLFKEYGGEVQCHYIEKQ